MWNSRNVLNKTLPVKMWTGRAEGICIVRCCLFVSFYTVRCRIERTIFLTTLRSLAMYILLSYPALTPWRPNDLQPINFKSSSWSRRHRFSFAQRSRIVSRQPATELYASAPCSFSTRLALFRILFLSTTAFAKSCLQAFMNYFARSARGKISEVWLSSSTLGVYVASQQVVLFGPSWDFATYAVIHDTLDVFSPW